VFILPVSRDNVFGKTPWVVIALIAVNTLLLAATYSANQQGVFSHYGFIPAQPRIATLFSSMFLHAGILHLLGNMWFLWMFGVRVEDRLGRSTFVLLYLLSGVGASALHYAFNIGSRISCVGASGAISGVVGAYFVFFPRSLFDLEIYLGRFRVKTIQTQTHVAVTAWIGEQVLLGLLSSYVHFSSVAFWAHVGGFAGGIVFARVFLVIKPPEGIEAVGLSVPAEVFLGVRDLRSMRRWYSKLGFVAGEATQEDKDYGAVLALKAGGDGQPILLRQADNQGTPTTILINVKQLEKARSILDSRGVKVSSIWWDRQDNECFSVHDPDGNTIKIAKMKVHS
jgi:membrane associated rhomboid family serine protease/catechol 2,3-dioxygenase-like lactoylglutathione lyase family enzyme